ncbi:MAG TPA: TlpA disulfide reductase family protein [Burkholderiales bacterium]|nr:TlpA disulfide reductase family protein [Burkholderiales bacterium]
MRALVFAAACALVQAAVAADFGDWTGPTPGLRLQDLHGREHRLADYRGRVVLVNFWATWCAPCREEMPSIGRLRRSLAGQPFEVLAVNVGEPASRIEKFRAQVPMDFPVLLDADTAAARAWKARFLPASYLVDADGRVRYTVYGALDWAGPAARAKVLELLGRAPRRAFESAVLRLPDLGRLGGFLAFHRGGRFLDQRDDALGVAVELLALVGDQYAAPVPLEQLHAEEQLEAPDARRHVGLHRIEQHGGAREATLLVHGDKVAKVLGVHGSKDYSRARVISVFELAKGARAVKAHSTCQGSQRPRAAPEGSAA